MKLILALALALTLVLGPGAYRHASAQPGMDDAGIRHITWLSADPAPPADGRPPIGLTSKMVAFMQANWPGVEHSVIPANAKRSWQLLENGEHVCQASSLRTPEREKIAYFITTQRLPPLQLIVRRDKLALLPRNAAGEVHLAQLLADEQLRGALIEGRSYGPMIDKLLAQRAPNAPLTLYPASDFGSKILPMLSMGRADYSIEHASGLSVGGERGFPVTQLVAQPIQGASDLIPAGVACPRNAWGLAATTRIDRLLATPAGVALLRESLEPWMTPELRAHYGARIEQFYKERAKPSGIR